MGTTELKADVTDHMVDTTLQKVDVTDHTNGTIEQKADFTDHTEDTTEQRVDVTDHTVDTTEQKADFTDHTVDTTEQKADFTDPMVDTTEQKADFTDHRMGTTELKADVTDHMVDTTEQKVDVTDHTVDTTEQKADFTDHTEDTTEQKADFTDHMVDTTEQKADFTDHRMGTTELKADVTDHMVDTTLQKVDFTDHTVDTTEQKVDFTDHMMSTSEQKVDVTDHTVDTTEQKVDFTDHIMDKTEQKVHFTDHTMETGEQNVDFIDHTYSVLSGSLCENECPLPGCPPMEKFNHVITTFMREQGIPGASVAISKHGKLVYKQGYGISGAGRRVQSGSLFRIASISKSLTAICILKLCEQSKLSLNATVFGRKGILSRYQPSAKGDKRVRQITVRHLLQHSAGWDRDQVGDPVFWRLEKITGRSGPTTNDELISYMMTRKLQFCPGKRHSYSNFGYLVLGAVIEAVTGMPYEDFVPKLFSERGFSPMRIGKEKKDVEKSDEVEYFHNRDPAVSRSIFAEDGLVSPPYGSFAMSGTGSFGGWVTSAPILVSIVNALEPGADNSILNAYWLTEMFARPSYESNLEHGWYGLGWDVQDSGSSWGHTGAMEGTSCTVMRHRSGLSWAVLFNAWAKDMDIDGMIKYGLSSIDEWPLWQPWPKESTHTPMQIVSADSEEVVGVLIPLADVKRHDFQMRSWGYSPRSINTLSHSNDVFVNIVWRKSLNTSFLLSHVPSQNLKVEVAKAKLQGFSLDLMEAYDYQGKTFLVLNFEKAVRDVSIQQIVYSDKSANEHEALRASYQNEGFLLISQSVISQDGVPKVAAIFNKAECPEQMLSSTESHVQRSFYRITPCNFTYELGRLAVKLSSFELTYLKFYNDVDNVSVSAVWTSNKVSASCKQRTIYYQRQDVSLYGFLYEIRESAAKNLRTRFICSYELEGVINFAVIWQVKDIKKLADL